VRVGYSGTPLPKKLGIKAGHRVGTLGAPERFARLLEPLPERVQVSAGMQGAQPFDVIVVFAVDAAELRRRFQTARERLRQDGGLWVAWPKRSSPLARELKESDVRTHGLAAGLVDNKICAIDEDWSGLRFVIRTADRT
jgi:hypothetical protein